MKNVYEDYNMKVFVLKFRTRTEANEYLKENGFQPDAEVWNRNEHGSLIGTLILRNSVVIVQCAESE